MVLDDGKNGHGTRVDVDAIELTVNRNDAPDFEGGNTDLIFSSMVRTWLSPTDLPRKSWAPNTTSVIWFAWESDRS